MCVVPWSSYVHQPSPNTTSKIKVLCNKYLKGRRKIDKQKSRENRKTLQPISCPQALANHYEVGWCHFLLCFFSFSFTQCFAIVGLLFCFSLLFSIFGDCSRQKENGRKKIKRRSTCYRETNPQQQTTNKKKKNY